MTSTFKKYAILAIAAAVGAACSAAVLLDDGFADSSRTETNLPNESAVWVSHPDRVVMGTGSLAFTQDGSSSKMWTYFASNGSPATLSVGDKLVATIVFSPRVAMYSTTSKNFRFGLFYDPTDDQLLEDANSDNGNGRWYDSTGYAVQFTLSPDSTAGAIQIGKRIDIAGSTNLLSSSGAYSWGGSSGQANNLSLDTAYTMKLELDYQEAEKMALTFTFSEGENVIAMNSFEDTGLGELPIYTAFDQLFFRMSSYTGTAEVLDYHQIKIEHITAEEPPYEGPPVGTVHTFWATESCRTELFDGTDPRMNDNRSDSSKLSVRSDYKAAKSWIKFEDLEIDPADMRAATLRITSYRDKSGTSTLSYVHDSCLDNIHWKSDTLTWNNAPGNIPSNDGENPADSETFTVTDLQENLDLAKTTVLAIVDYSDGTVAGDQFFFDVLPIVQEDTDGIVQFALHGTSGLMDFGTHTHPAGEVYWPMLEILIPPAGADWPIPYYGQTVETTTSELKWTLPEPNLPGGEIYCDVYFGTEPNRPEMDMVTLAVGENSAALTAGNFPRFAPIQDEQTYYWVVDCHDSSRDEVVPGLMWTFYVNDNKAPVVDAGPDQVMWGLPQTIALDGQTSDDGLPIPPGLYTIEWTQTSGPSVDIDPDDTDDTSVEITETGVYEFQLTANDGAKQTSDTVRIVVGEDACDASHLNTGDAYNRSDVNEDCLVNLEDYALLIAVNWMDCTDTLSGCN